MCAGVRFSINGISDTKLKKYFTPKEIDFYKKRGEIDIFFFSKKPFLPVNRGGDIDLVDWGNRDKKIKLPKTGWARQESLQRHKWDYLNPKKVEIPVNEGYEKDIWFKTDPLQGVEIKKENEDRVYMITKPSSPSYKKLTGHDREPVIIKKEKQ